MTRLYILFLFAFYTLYGFAKQIDPKDYVLMSIRSINETLVLQDGDFDTIFINSNGLPFNINDTLINETRFIFSTSKENLFFLGAKFWFETINFEYGNKKVEYRFCFNSWQEIEDFKYMEGLLEFEKDNGNWELIDKRIKVISFDKIPELDSPLFKQKPQRGQSYTKYYNFDLKKLAERDLKNLTDTIIGNWYSLEDIDYTESLFINDSIYEYSKLIGHLPPVRYDLEQNDLIITRMNSNKVKLSITVIDINTIRFFGVDTLVYENKEPEYHTIDIILHRIPDTEFRYSDINCWKEKETRNGRGKYSKDVERYSQGFMKRYLKASE